MITTQERRGPRPRSRAHNSQTVDASITARQPDSRQDDDTWGAAAAAAHAATAARLAAEDRAAELEGARQEAYQAGIRDGYKWAVGDWRRAAGYWLPADLRDTA